MHSDMNSSYFCFMIRFLCVFVSLLGQVSIIHLCILFDCQYQCKQLPGKTCLRNDVLCVDASGTLNPAQPLMVYAVDDVQMLMFCISACTAAVDSYQLIVLLQKDKKGKNPSKKKRKKCVIL